MVYEARAIAADLSTKSAKNWKREGKLGHPWESSKQKRGDSEGEHFEIGQAHPADVLRAADACQRRFNGRGGSSRY
jgi:hypothetical protein